jgi:hypothetical protein
VALSIQVTSLSSEHAVLAEVELDLSMHRHKPSMSSLHPCTMQEHVCWV